MNKIKLFAIALIFSFFSYSSTSYAAIAEIESNNSFSTAQDLGVLTSTLAVVGHIDENSDTVDNFSFSLVNASVVVFDIDFAIDALGDGFGLDTYLELWKEVAPNTYQFIDFNDDGPDDVGSSGDWDGDFYDSFLQKNLDIGTYIVSIFASPDADDEYLSGGYCLSLRIPSINSEDTFTTAQAECAVSAVPEPSILALFGFGLIGLNFIRRRLN